MYGLCGLGAVPSLSFQQTSGTGYPNFHVGDSWSIRITGDANQPVTITGGQNGQVITTQMGQTDASGVFTLTGTMTVDQVGSWSESWSVGGVSVGSFTFTVSPAASTPVGSSTPAPSSTSSYLSPNVVNTLTASSGLEIAGYEVPWWAIAAAGGLVLLLVSGGKRR